MELTLSITESNFIAFTEYCQQQITNFCNNLLPATHSNTHLSAAMRYSVLNNGKRIRPMLVYALGQALGTPYIKLHAAATSIELIHCYSLIHDDLPAMDDDDLRRGLPSCHKAFDEATAILAGDALQSLAFEVLSNPQLNPVGSETQIAMIRALAKAAGVAGMAQGQALDLAAQHQSIKLEDLRSVHKHKTGALFNACIDLSFLASDHTGNKILHEQLQNFSDNLGLAFQIQDDILDVTSDTATLGKPIGSDQKLNKATFVSLLGINTAQQQADTYLQKAINCLNALGDNADILRNLAIHLKNRWR